MSTLYKSILQAQPADGDAVFVRRFTRDPPVRAIWQSTLQQFALTNARTLTVVGGTYAGVYIATFTTNAFGTGRPAWFYNTGTVKIQAFSNTPGTWTLQQSDYGGAGYAGPTYPDPAGPATANSLPAFGSPSWAGPSSISLSDTSIAQLLIPAALIQAWRPL